MENSFIANIYQDLKDISTPQNVPSICMTWFRIICAVALVKCFCEETMEIGVADTAEQDFDLNVVLGWMAPRDRAGSKRRYPTLSGVALALYMDLSS